MISGWRSASKNSGPSTLARIAAGSVTEIESTRADPSSARASPSPRSVRRDVGQRAAEPEDAGVAHREREGRGLRLGEVGAEEGLDCDRSPWRPPGSSSAVRRSDSAAGRPVTAQRWPSLSGLRTMRTAWIRPSTTSTVSTLQTWSSAGCRAHLGRARGPHQRRELLRVDVARLHERQRLIGREPLCVLWLPLGRAAQHAAGLAVDPHPPALERVGIGRAPEPRRP